MAVVLNQNNDDDETQQTGQPIQTNVGAVGSITPGSSVAGPSAPTSSGRFNNITNFIKANQNYNKEGGGVGGKVASNLETEGNNITQNVANAVTAAKTQSAAPIQQVGNSLNLGSTITSDPTKLNTDQIKNINSSLTGGYTAADRTLPNESAQVQDFSKKTDLVQNSAGRYTLLKDMFNKPTYTSGQRTLDNLLMSGNSDQLKRLGNTKTIASNIENAISAGGNDIDAANVANKAAFTTEQNKLKDLIKGAGTSLSGTIASSTDAYNKSKEKEYLDAVAKLQLGQGSEVTGYNPETKTYGVNVNQFLNKNFTPVKQEQFARPEDYAKVQALKSLLTGVDSPELNSLFNTFTNPESSVDLNSPAYKFDGSAFEQAVSGQKAAYEAQANPLTSEMSGLEAKIKADTDKIIQHFERTKGSYGNQQAWEQARQRNIETAIGPQQAQLAQKQTEFQKLKDLFKLGQTMASTNLIAAPKLSTGPRGKPGMGK